MKRIGLFLLLFLIIGVLNVLIMKRLTPGEIIIETTLLSYITLRYIISESKKK